MRRASTTVIAIVGSDAAAAVDQLGRAANVRPITADTSAAPLERAIQASQEAERAHVPYVVHDADPLRDVADAWVRLYDGTGPVGELEVAVHETLTRWRAGSVELPDYYFVLDAESLEPTRRHWYLGVLHDAAPARVVPVGNRFEALADAVAGLSSGRWWPDVDRLLDGIERVVPDRAGMGTTRGAGRQ